MNRLPQIQLSKWQLALLLGTPLAIGAGYYIYQKSKSGSKSKPKGKVEGVATIIMGEKKQNKKVAEQTEIVTPLKAANNYKAEGNVFYRNGKFDEAIKCYDKAIETCPQENKTDLAIFHQNRAAAYEMLKKWNCVKEDCSKSLQYNPRYTKAYFRRAKAHEATNNIAESLNDITACCMLETFQNENTILFADRVLKRSGMQDAERHIADRKHILPSDNFIRTYLKSFVHDPLQNMALHEDLKDKQNGFSRAIIAIKENQYGKVIDACTEEIETLESDSQYKMEALLLRGTFHLLTGNFNQALLDLTAVIDNIDANKLVRSHAYMKRASVKIQMEQKDEGMTDFDEAQKVDPENADVYHQRAQIYILLNELDKALEQFDKVLKLAPDHAMAYVQKCYTQYRYSITHQDHARLMVTLNDFRNAIDKFPDCVECYSLFAQVLTDQQQFEQADQFFEKALAITPTNGTLYVHRGVMLLQWKGDIEKSVALMERAIEVDNKCELAYETLGTLEVQRAKLDRAIELFEKAIELAKSQSEMSHLYALRNAAITQQNVTKNLGIDIKAVQQLTETNTMGSLNNP